MHFLVLLGHDAEAELWILKDAIRVTYKWRFSKFFVPILQYNVSLLVSRSSSLKFCPKPRDEVLTLLQFGSRPRKVGTLIRESAIKKVIFTRWRLPLKMEKGNAINFWIVYRQNHIMTEDEAGVTGRGSSGMPGSWWILRFDRVLPDLIFSLLIIRLPILAKPVVTLQQLELIGSRIPPPFAMISVMVSKVFFSVLHSLKNLIEFFWDLHRRLALTWEKKKMAKILASNWVEL